MSAAEVIELIKKLPPEEQAEVRAFVRSGEASEPAGKKIRYLPQAEAERIAEKVFKDHSELFRKLAQ